MRTEKEILKEINDMTIDLENMKVLPIHTEKARQQAIFCQTQVIKVLKWCLE